MMPTDAPRNFYGILERCKADNTLDEVVEQVRNLGYAVLDSGFTLSQIQEISDEFDNTLVHYIETYGESRLRTINEIYTIRSPFAHGGRIFIDLVLNARLLSVLESLISGKFILNQQNGVINPPQEIYNQGSWHRDLPYQHFLSSRPLAINALFCVDDFNFDNGATFVLPASHKSEAFPSENYISKNAVQIEAKAGSFIVLDCMLFHSGGYNYSSLARRAINHVYTIPFFKQQINIPRSFEGVGLSVEEKSIFGFDYVEPNSILEFLSARDAKSTKC